MAQFLATARRPGMPGQLPSSSQVPAFQGQIPSVSLPKGGGAIRGIGEKSAASPVTGTGSMSLPIATRPGQSGCGPHLSLSYDSGVGNGPFGFGWGLTLPSITGKTDKGLPQDLDTTDSDVTPAMKASHGDGNRSTQYGLHGTPH